MEATVSSLSGPGGRPTREQAEQLRERILAAASRLFLEKGYGAVSIEAVAKAAGISKRTFYHRFGGKADLFAAVAHRLIEGLKPRQELSVFEGDNARDVLARLARIIVKAALQPDALALHRLLLSEARQFPELAAIMEGEGARREALGRIAVFLEHSSLAHPAVPATFAADQFLHLVTAEPQRRALGLGKPMDEAELEAWCDRSVALFLNGCAGGTKLISPIPPDNVRAGGGSAGAP